MKKALLIGANGTIGRALVKQLSLSQYNVSVLSQQDTDYSEDSLRTRFDEFADNAPFQLIICCIGTLHNEFVSPEKRLAHLDSKVLAEYFRVNTILPALCLRFFYPLLDNKTHSKFICLSAMVGSIGDNQLGGWYGYRSSKAALNMMMKTASIEVARSNKQACLAVVHPGTTQGPLSKPYASGVGKNRYYAPSQSAQRIVELSEALTPSETGSFFNWDGSRLPW